MAGGAAMAVNKLEFLIDNWTTFTKSTATTFKWIKLNLLMQPAQRYLQYFTNIFDKEPRIYKNESSEEYTTKVCSLIFNNIPEPGFTTAITYGLPLANHSD